MDEKLIKKWKDAGQGHVFKFLNDLSDVERKKFENQLTSIDIEESCKIFKQSMNTGPVETKANEIRPFTGATVAAEASAEDRAAWRQRGLEAIAKGQVATLLLAGGQGTRLGFNHPKGMYVLDLPSRPSLFQLHAERTMKAYEMAVSESSVNDPVASCLPWYVMTSNPTHEETVKFFQENKYFGLPADSVFFFRQGTLPCFTFDGQVIMSSKSSIAEAPDGNGGVYLSLLRSGALDDMERRGVQLVCQYGVDNCLALPADPEFIGFQLMSKADCAAKTVAKRAPSERVGVMASVNGRAAVVEYSEITEEMANAREEKGGAKDSASEPARLLYRSCHICVNSFSIDFLRKLVAPGTGVLARLPYHVARKKIPAIDMTGSGGENASAPTEPNGVKLEAFIFDVFGDAEKCLAFEVDRSEQFSPLKNAEGNDSPESCRQLVSDLWRRRIIAAGAQISNERALCEVSPLLSLAGEGLNSVCQGKEFQDDNIFLHK